VQSKLGKFSDVREFLEEPKRLIGLDAAAAAAAASPAPPEIKKPLPNSSQHYRYKDLPPPASSGSSSASSRHVRPPPNTHQNSPKINGNLNNKAFSAFNRPASKNLTKLDGIPVSTTHLTYSSHLEELYFLY
jgi:hypothetical protein